MDPSETDKPSRNGNGSSGRNGSGDPRVTTGVASGREGRAGSNGAGSHVEDPTAGSPSGVTGTARGAPGTGEPGENGSANGRAAENGSDPARNGNAGAADPGL